MIDYLGLPIDVGSGAQWVRGSLGSGSILSTLVSKRLGDFTAARILVPEEALAGLSGLLDDDGKGVQTSDADLVAGRVLEKFAAAGVQTVVVEDDLARRGDASLAQDVAYVQDHVLRWADLTNGPVGGAQLLRGGSSGYPLNAYACWLSPVELGLEPGRDLEEKERESIVASTCAVFVSVYDAEAFVVLMSPELGVCLE